MGKDSGQRVPALPAPQAQVKNAFHAKNLANWCREDSAPTILADPRNSSKMCISCQKPC